MPNRLVIPESDLTYPMKRKMNANLQNIYTYYKKQVYENKYIKQKKTFFYLILITFRKFWFCYCKFT